METIVSPVHLYCVGTLGHNGGVPANQVLFSYASPSRALAPASVSAATTTVLIAVVAPVVPPGPVMVAVAIRDVSGVGGHQLWQQTSCHHNPDEVAGTEHDGHRRSGGVGEGTGSFHGKKAFRRGRKDVRSGHVAHNGHHGENSCRRPSKVTMSKRTVERRSKKRTSSERATRTGWPRRSLPSRSLTARSASSRARYSRTLQITDEMKSSTPYW